MIKQQESSAKAPLFNTVRGSFVDGYGIRTTIFLKGCPLKCKWCCNPEGQSFAPQVKIQKERCTGCGKCVDVCKAGALSVVDGCVVVDRKKCTGCGECEWGCWYDALEMYGKTYTAEEVFRMIERDKTFFEESGGGLTIGGGEATCYPAFCNEMIERCHKEGISVAIDTCGYIDTEERFSVLEHADLILYDIKGLDEEKHIANTGVSNKIILKNLKRLDELKKSVIIRYPVIPGYNMDEAEEIADFLTKFSCIERVDLIPYHKFGTSKYEQIGMEYTVEAETLPEEERQQLLELFLKKGLHAQLGG